MGAAATPAGCPPATLVAAVVSTYLELEKKLLGAVDRGYGVYLTLPWPAIYFEYLWLIIPTPLPRYVSSQMRHRVLLFPKLPPWADAA